MTRSTDRWTGTAPLRVRHAIGKGSSRNDVVACIDQLLGSLPAPAPRPTRHDGPCIKLAPPNAGTGGSRPDAFASQRATGRKCADGKSSLQRQPSPRLDKPFQPRFSRALCQRRVVRQLYTDTLQKIGTSDLPSQDSRFSSPRYSKRWRRPTATVSAGDQRVFGPAVSS